MDGRNWAPQESGRPDDHALHVLCDTRNLWLDNLIELAAASHVEQTHTKRFRPEPLCRLRRDC